MNNLIKYFLISYIYSIEKKKKKKKKKDMYIYTIKKILIPYINIFLFYI